MKIKKDITWRTVASTTLTFLTKRAVLLDTDKSLTQFKNGHKDTIICLRLTKYRVLNPPNLVIFIFIALISRVSNYLKLTKNFKILIN